MNKTKKSYGVIASIVALIMLVVTAVGVLSFASSIIETDIPVFFLRIDEKIIAKDVADYVISHDNPLTVDTVFPFALFSDEENKDYEIDIKANEGVRFSIDVDGQRYEFDNSRDWNQVFEIVSTKKGFRLFPKFDTLDQIFACVYEGQLVEFYIPKDVLNLFCATISSKDGVISYNVYFTLEQQLTEVTFEKKEILF